MHTAPKAKIYNGAVSCLPWLFRIDVSETWRAILKRTTVTPWNNYYDGRSGLDVSGDGFSNIRNVEH